LDYPARPPFKTASLSRQALVLRKALVPAVFGKLDPAEPSDFHDDFPISYSFFISRSLFISRTQYMPIFFAT
jgi:hypothetical protein